MNLDTYFLNPGELLFTTHPINIKTILGSCVAVCLYDRVNGYGGMCHYLLPETSENKDASTKYGSIAIPVLIKKFLTNNSERKNLEASVIGGSLILYNQNEIFFIGDRNVAIANELLNKHKIRIRTSDYGGEKGRTIIFNTHTGNISVKSHHEYRINDMLIDSNTGESTDNKIGDTL